MTRFKAATRREFIAYAVGAGLWISGMDGEQAWAQNSTPSAAVMDNAATVTRGDYAASVGLTDGHIQINVPGNVYHLTPSILNDSAWTQPTHTLGPPVVHNFSDSAQADVEFPIAAHRILTISLTAYRDVPGVYVITRLKNLGKLRQEYYFWSWEATYTSYFTPHEGVIVERHSDLSTLDHFGYNGWVYLPEQSGGLAAFTKQTLGRGAKNDATTYLQSMPINQFIGPGQSMDMGIGFAQAGSPEDAQKLYAVLSAKAIPALKVAAQIPDLSRMDYGKPAPAWVRGTDKYNCWPQSNSDAPAAWTHAGLARDLHPFRFLSHVPNDKTVIDRCHKSGLRVVMYLNFMEMLNSAIQRQAGEKGAVYLNGNWGKIVDHENMDLAKHPNWVSYDEKGKARQSGWGAANNIPGLFNTCLHQMDLHDDVIQQTKDMLALGVDGIFIDNAAAIPECFGDKFGKHKHAFPDKTNTEMYDMLIQRVYNTVKSFDEEKILVLNSGINPNQWAYCDVQMWESCLYGAGVVAKTTTWEDAQYAGEIHAEAVRHGKVPIILSYFDDQPITTRNDRVLYTYAYARLYDLGWGDWFTMIGKDGDVKDAIDLYNAQLGKSIGDVSAKDRVYSRVFEHGAVMVNPDLWSKKAAISVPRNGMLHDVCHHSTLSVEDRTVTIEMAPESGRVLIWK